MKLILLVWYKLKIILSDRLFLVSMVVIPLLLAYVMGSAIRFEKFGSIPVGVVDEDKSKLSSLVFQRLSSKEGISFKMYEKEDAIKQLKDNKLEAIFVFKEGFEKDIMSGKTSELIDFIKSPTSFSADFIGEVVAGEVIRPASDSFAANTVVQQYNRLGIKIKDSLFNEVYEYTDSLWQPKPLMTMNYTELEGNRQVKVDRISIPYNSSASIGMLVLFVMFYILFGSGWLVEEKSNGTLKRLVTGSGALLNSYAANILVLFIAGVFQVSIFLVFCKLILKVDILKGPVSFFLFGVYILAVISICMMLSAILKTSAQLQAGAPVFTILSGFIGGCFWNNLEISKTIKQLALITPQGWVIDGVDRLFINPANLNPVIPHIFVLSIVPIVLLPISYILVKRQVEN